jgi:hypothetical protein
MPLRHPYFDIVVGLAWSYDPESYAGGNVVIGRVSNAGEVKVDDSNKKIYSGPPGWGFGVRFTIAPRKKS